MQSMNVGIVTESLLFSLCFVDSVKVQDKDGGGGPVGIPPLPAISKKYGVQVKSTTSGSSGEQSDDDEAEGENESTQNMDPTDAKRMRRYSTEYFSCQCFAHGYSHEYVRNSP